MLRHTAEKCDAMSSWFIIHSMGGGTGSGLGTNVLSVLADEFPDIERLVTPGIGFLATLLISKTSLRTLELSLSIRR